MVNQAFIPTLDISAFIWDKEDYQANQHQYWGILRKVPDLIKGLDTYLILINDELIRQMINGFPYTDIPSEFWAIGHSVYDFLGNIGSKKISYPEKDIPALSTEPNQVKSHFNEETKREVGYLVSYLHNTPDEKNTIFSFQYLWNDSDILETEADSTTIGHRAVIADRGNSLEAFFDQFRLLFEHHFKHDLSPHGNKEAWKAWVAGGRDREFISQLSCYDPSEEDTARAQELLDERYDKTFGNSNYYSYDLEHDVYVVFRLTNANIYHAHDEYDIQNVPQEVKNHFNVLKYSWL